MLLGTIIAAAIGGIVAVIRYTVWKERVPDIISKYRWLIGILLAFLAIVIEVALNVEVKGVIQILNAIIVLSCVQVLKNKEPISTRHCANCNNILNGKDKFCPHCGSAPNIKTPTDSNATKSHKLSNEYEFTCSNCGNPLKENDKFCSHCGEKLTGVIDEEENKKSVIKNEIKEVIHSCPNCLQIVDKSDKFCSNCGTGIDVGDVFEINKSDVALNSNRNNQENTGDAYDAVEEKNIPTWKRFRDISLIILVTIVVFIIVLTSRKETTNVNKADYGNNLMTLDSIKNMVYKEKNFYSAIKELTKIIKNNPRTVEALQIRAVAKGMVKDNYGAIDDWNTAIAIDSLDFMLFFGRAYTYKEIGNLRNAFNDYSKCIDINHECFQAYHNRALILMGWGRYFEALEDLNHAIKLNDNDSLSYLKRAQLKIIYLSDKEGGCLDLSKAGELGSIDAYDLIERYCK